MAKIPSTKFIAYLRKALKTPPSMRTSKQSFVVSKWFNTKWK
jgi:hypothetical protein